MEHQLVIGRSITMIYYRNHGAECELRDHAAPSAGSLATAFDDSTATLEWSCGMEHATDK